MTKVGQGLLMIALAAIKAAAETAEEVIAKMAEEEQDDVATGKGSGESAE